MDDLEESDKIVYMKQSNCAIDKQRKRNISIDGQETVDENLRISSHVKADLEGRIEAVDGAVSRLGAKLYSEAIRQGAQELCSTQLLRGLRYLGGLAHL